MILKKLLESKPKEIDDIELKDDEKSFQEDLVSLDPKFEGLKNNTIKTLRNIYISDMEPEEVLAEEFLDWFYLSGRNFLEFVCYNYDRIPTAKGRSGKGELPVFVIRDLAEHEELFSKALFNVAKAWKVIDAEGRDLTDAEKEHTRVLSVPELVEVLFLDVCSKGVKHAEQDYSAETDWEKIPNESVRDTELLKELCKALLESVGISSKGIVEKFEHVCEKCGHSPCICEEAEIEQPEEVKEEPIEAPAEEEVEKPVEVSAEVEKTAFNDMINNTIQTQWDMVSTLNGMIATFEFNYNEANKEDIINILNQMVDDTTINIGMLHKVSELVSQKTSALLNAGEEKAEEIISEPESENE